MLQRSKDGWHNTVRKSASKLRIATGQSECFDKNFSSSDSENRASGAFKLDIPLTVSIVSLG